MIFLDTNILVNILRNEARGQTWINYLKDKSVALTSITFFELYLGAELSKKREYNIKIIQNLFQQFPVFSFNVKTSRIAANIYSDLKEKGQIIELNDIYLASIVLEQNSILATDNIKHFNRIQSLKLITV
jgi:predicted nucleic acid-binding protein